MILLALAPKLRFITFLSFLYSLSIRRRKAVRARDLRLNQILTTYCIEGAHKISNAIRLCNVRVTIYYS